jgi:hypothetical protein
MHHQKWTSPNRAKEYHSECHTFDECGHEMRLHFEHAGLNGTVISVGLAMGVSILTD